ncbi:MAG: hypothetical protein AAFP99_10560 [Pseudomonadota bacterium]
MDRPNDPAKRTQVLFTPDGQKAVIALRRGKTHNQLINWDVETDSFTPGQWMKGQVYLCDLSADGEELLYFAAQRHRVGRRQDAGHRSPNKALYDAASAHDIYAADVGQFRKRYPRRKLPSYMSGAPKERSGHASKSGYGRKPVIGDTWTAVSKPPYFSALALWPADGTWTGGGFFASKRHVLICEPPKQLLPHENAPLPPKFKIESAFDTTHAQRKRSSLTPHLGVADSVSRLGPVIQEQGLRRCDWVISIKPGELLFSGDGKLFRLVGYEDVNPEHMLDEAQMIADFSDHMFEQITPPAWATRW